MGTDRAKPAIIDPAEALLDLRAIVQLHTADGGGCPVCGTDDACITRDHALAASRSLGAENGRDPLTGEEG